MRTEEDALASLKYMTTAIACLALAVIALNVSLWLHGVRTEVILDEYRYEMGLIAARRLR